MPKTKSEILEEFKTTYIDNPDNRAVTEGGCVYYDSATGQCCAVGRCMLPKVRDALKDNVADLEWALIVVYTEYGKPIATTFEAEELLEEGGLDDLLNPAYRGHSAVFWRDLQLMHDASSNWMSKADWKRPSDAFPALDVTGERAWRRLLTNYKDQ